VFLGAGFILFEGVKHRHLAAMIILGFLPGLLMVLFVDATIGINDGAFETGKYAGPARGLLETGSLGRIHEETGKFVAELQRLPVLPIIIAAVFWVAGTDNYLAVGIVQCFMAGLTVIGMALTARAINRGWMWPSAVLTAGWPILIWRTSIVLPRTTMLLFLVWGLAALLWAAKSQKPAMLLALSGMCIGALMLTHPHALLVPIFLVPSTILLLRNVAAMTWRRAAAMTLIPALMTVVMMGPQVMRINHYTNRIGYVHQSGTHVLEWLYPCLARSWGCGTPNPEATARHKQALKQGLEALTPGQRNNPQVVINMMRKLGFELISDLPLGVVISSVVGSTVKMLLHPFSVELIERFKLSRVHFSNISADHISTRIKRFLTEASTSGATLFWLLSQITLLGSRLIQVVGLASVTRDRVLIWYFAPILISAAAFTLVSIGFGNPRYRVPLEPALILLTIPGFEAIKGWWRTRSSAQVDQ